MGRPPLPVGTYGRIKVDKLDERRFRARAKYRDYDGVTRKVERVGSSRTAAENNLKQALRDRAHVSADGEITARTKVSRLAELWLRDIDESDRAIRTKITYRDVWERCLSAPVGELRIGDIQVSGVDRVVRESASAGVLRAAGTPRSCSQACSAWRCVTMRWTSIRCVS